MYVNNNHILSIHCIYRKYIFFIAIINSNAVIIDARAL